MSLREAINMQIQTGRVKSFPSGVHLCVDEHVAGFLHDVLPGPEQSEMPAGAEAPLERPIRDQMRQARAHLRSQPVGTRRAIRVGQASVDQCLDAVANSYAITEGEQGMTPDTTRVEAAEMLAAAAFLLEARQEAAA